MKSPVVYRLLNDTASWTEVILSRYGQLMHFSFTTAEHVINPFYPVNELSTSEHISSCGLDTFVFYKYRLN
jgi:hypothetical protein